MRLPYQIITHRRHEPVIAFSREQLQTAEDNARKEGDEHVAYLFETLQNILRTGA